MRYNFCVHPSYYSFQPAYPTPAHARAAEAIRALFAPDPAVDSVLLVNSCARGKASPDSCLDVVILARPPIFAREKANLEALWQQHYPRDPVYAELLHVGAFSQVDLHFTDGHLDPADFYHGWTSGADEFELAVGNLLAYSVPLHDGPYYQELRARWLPYYDEDLRRARLPMVLGCCRNNLAHVPLFARRGLYFQAFKRLYHALEEFLQALFIAWRVYPIAYDKWVREEIVDILGLPELYAQLTVIPQISIFESEQVIEKAAQVEALILEYGLFAEKT